MKLPFHKLPYDPVGDQYGKDMSKRGSKLMLVGAITVLLISFGIAIMRSTFAQNEPTPAIVLSPSSGPADSVITIHGKDFPPSAIITIRFDDTILTTEPIGIVANETGAFSAVVLVPISASNGQHEISARDEAGHITLATFIVGEAAIHLSPTVGTIGTQVNVTGSGFIPNRGITVNMDADLMSTSETSSSGTFETSFIIPSTATLGSHNIVATDGVNTVTSALVVEGPEDSSIFIISNPQLVDQLGNEMSSPSVGNHLIVRTEIENSLSTDEAFTYIVQVKDSGGATIMISWMEGIIPAEKQYKVAQSWLAESPGEYTAEVFVWRSLSEPLVLAPMKNIAFTVAE